MDTFKGIIALDVDGTITVEKHFLEEKIYTYLNHLIAEKWLVVFITGRTFSFARPLFTEINGKYLLAVQNGAALYEMPGEKCIEKNYLITSILEPIATFFYKSGIGLLVESGKENQDICYYKPADFSEEELEYINFRISISPEKWQTIDDFAVLKLQEFAVGKYFAREKQALELANKMINALPLNVIVIRDPFRSNFYLGHVNATQASKGAVLTRIIASYPKNLPVIAAGDDYNDVEMLEKGTVKIVMENAPERLHKLADILAPPAAQAGIVQGIEEAIWKLSSK